MTYTELLFLYMSHIFSSSFVGVSDSAAICGHGRKRNVCPDCAAALQGAKVKYLTDKDIEDAAYEVRLSVLSR